MFAAITREVNLVAKQCDLHSENLGFLKIMHKNTKGINLLPSVIFQAGAVLKMIDQVIHKSDSSFKICIIREKGNRTKSTCRKLQVLRKLPYVLQKCFMINMKAY